MDVITSKQDSVFTITINRPEKRNAISDGVIDGMLAAFDEAHKDSDAKVIVLTGAGEKIFCAGGDLAGFANSDGFYGMHQARGKFARLLEAFRASKLPIIGRVNGHALGGGFGLAMACDVVVAADTAKFGLAEIKVGVFPMMIMPVIVRNIGRKRALELMFTGERVDAETLHSWGCVNHVVPAEALDARVNALANTIAGYSGATLALGRSAFYRTEDMDFSQAVSSLHNDLTITTLTDDAAEGVMAFLGKREPEWKNK